MKTRMPSPIMTQISVDSPNNITPPRATRKSSTTKDTLRLRSAPAPVHEPCGTGASWLRVIKFKSRTISLRPLPPPIFFRLLLDWLSEFVLFSRHFLPWTHVGNSTLLTLNHNSFSFNNHQPTFRPHPPYPPTPPFPLYQPSPSFLPY